MKLTIQNTDKIIGYKIDTTTATMGSSGCRS
jgi:hypothetical protein